MRKLVAHSRLSVCLSCVLALGACSKDHDSASSTGMAGASGSGAGSAGTSGASGAGVAGSGANAGGSGVAGNAGSVSGTAGASSGGSAGQGGAAGSATGQGGASGGTALSFFVSSQKNTTGDLGGLSGADARCQTLAAAVGAGSSTWHAYLSVEHDAANGNAPVNARDRIGKGPWYNAKGALVAADLASLHTRTGDANVFLDERGNKINGQWTGSPSPLEHDILTGSDTSGALLVGMTCADWTSTSTTMAAQVGHSDGLGPQMDASAPLSSWNSAHANQSCADTAPRGGAGRIYCFAVK